MKKGLEVEGAKAVWDWGWGERGCLLCVLVEGGEGSAEGPRERACKLIEFDMNI